MDRAPGAWPCLGLRRRGGGVAAFGGVDRGYGKSDSVRVLPVLTGNIPSHAGVYHGMFEQSLLADSAGPRKTATFAASLTAQILVAGVLVVVPLLYHDVLPACQVRALVPALAGGGPPEPPVDEARPAARSSGLALPHAFRPLVVLHSNY